MRAKPIYKEEQYRLIMECRSSGLTDYQWCTEHNIKPGTFYNWIARFRREGYPNIPEPLGRESIHKSDTQEAVKLELASYENSPILAREVEQNARITTPSNLPSAATVEIQLRNATVRLTNDVNPKLLEVVLQTVGDYQ